MHSQLDFRPVQIITDHVIYNSPYKYWPAENGQGQRFVGCDFEKPWWIGDGYCDDGPNYAECGFDHGDCCGNNVNTDYCNDCKCKAYQQIGMC